MAFACRPSLIVLDEPTTGLDVSTQRHVLETVRNLCDSYGVAAVYVSHDLAVVGGLVSEVAVMYAGRVIELGATAPCSPSRCTPTPAAFLLRSPRPSGPKCSPGSKASHHAPGVDRRDAPSPRGAATPSSAAGSRCRRPP